jgi:phytanoyl-CoA hydroxylase
MSRLSYAKRAVKAAGIDRSGTELHSLGFCNMTEANREDNFPSCQGGLNKMGLNEQLVDEYLENGYLIVRDVLTAEESAALKTDSEGLALGRFPTANANSPSLGGGQAGDAGAVLAEMTGEQRLQAMILAHFPQWVSPAFDHIVQHQGLRAILDSLVAARLDRIDAGEAKCLQDYIFCKPPGEAGKAWHQDATYIKTDARSLTGVWIPIDDAAIDNGCLWVVPGSHQSGELFRMERHGRDDYDNAPVSIGFDDQSEVPIEVKAGDVVFFDGHLLHRSGPNTTERSRHALVMHWLDSGTPYVWKFPGDPVWPPASASITWRFPNTETPLDADRPLTELEKQGLPSVKG